MKNHNYTLYILGVLILISGIECKQKKVSKAALRQGNEVEPSLDDVEQHEKRDPDREFSAENVTSLCWVGMFAKWLFHTMGKLDAQYSGAREAYDQAAIDTQFDKKLLEEILNAQGASQRDIHYSLIHRSGIPHGFNLGGRSMIRLADSVLFFHRLKLRNNTVFRMDHIHSDLENMTLTARLTLNDLHLGGSYERALTDPVDPSNLFYRPTYGELDILLKNARYKMEGRYRLLKDQLIIELIMSDVLVSEVLLMYKPNATCGDTVEKIEITRVDKLLRSVRTSLDIWMRNYFNDYLRYYGTPGMSASPEIQEYDRMKATTLNRYVDQSIEVLKKRMMKFRATCMVTPGFKIYTINGMQIRLKGGKLRGLDTIHRRSVATGRLDEGIRYVDSIIGFGKLELVYQYEALVSAGHPPVTGLLVLSSDQLTAKMAMAIVRDPETAEVFIDFFEQLSPETLTVEGPLIRMIANFKHIVEHHIMTLLYNTVIHYVKLLGHLTQCTPNLPESCGADGEDETPLGLSDEGNIIPYIPEKDLRQALIGLARADSVEFEVPSSEDGKTHRKKMLLRYNERVAILEVSTNKGETPAPTERSLGKVTTPKTSADDEDIKMLRDDTIEIEMDGKPKKIKYWEGAAMGKNPSGPKKALPSNEDDIRISREDSVEIEMDGKPKKIKYWEGAAMGKDPSRPKNSKLKRRRLSRAKEGL